MGDSIFISLLTTTVMTTTSHFLLALLLMTCAHAAHAQGDPSLDGCPETEARKTTLPVVDPEAFQAVADARLVLGLGYDQCGDVVKATVEQSSGFRQIDAAARALALTWRLAPDRSQGKPMDGKLQISLNFSGKPSTPPENGKPEIQPPPPPPTELNASDRKAPPLPELPAPYRYFNAPVGSLGREPPLFPPMEGLFGVGGTVVLIVDIDPAGNAANISIERSTRNRNLDRQALQAAKSWRFLPSVSGGRTVASRARVPVNFSPYESWTIGLRDRKPERSRIPEVARLPDGTLPGYIPDPLPLGMTSIADALAMLRKEAGPRRADRGEKFLMEDDNGISKWSVCESGCPTAPVLRRWRLVNDGTHAFWASTILCESADPTACADFRNFVEKGSPPQRAIRIQ